MSLRWIAGRLQIVAVNKKKPNAKQLLTAVNRHDLDSLQRLLSNDADPKVSINFTHRGNVSILTCAAGIQFAKGVELLLNAGADPNIAAVAGPGAGGGGTALHGSIYGSDTRPGTETKRATREDKLKIVDLLLNAGADPNAVDQGDRLPLFYAANSGYLDICQRLIKAGATFKTWPVGCRPPLVGAAAGVPLHGVIEGQRQEEVAGFLLDLGAPVDGEDAKGMTPLMWAAHQGSERLVDLFIKHGAAVNRRSRDGRTPLINAAMYAERTFFDDEHELALRIIKRLIGCGADATARNEEGESAYDIASSSRSRGLLAAEYLKGLTV